MVKRLVKLKKCLKKQQVELKKKKEFVLIRVHLETGRLLTVVQRFKVAFMREIWLLFCTRETLGLSARVSMYAFTGYNSTVRSIIPNYYMEAEKKPNALQLFTFKKSLFYLKKF